MVEPSIDTTRSPQQNTPGAPSAAPTGPATCSNSMCSGSAPSRARARDREEMFGGRHRRPCPGIDPAVRVEHPASSCRAAAAVIQRVHQLDHHPPVAAVRAPEQPQRQHEVHHQPAPAATGAAAPGCRSASTTRSTSSGGNALVNAPTEIRSGNQPSGETPSDPSCATKRSRYHIKPLRQGHWAASQAFAISAQPFTPDHNDNGE